MHEAMKITVEDLQSCTLRHIAHLDGPRGSKGWFGDMHECIQHPRLQRRTRYFRRDRSHDVVWYVDGHVIQAPTPDAGLAHAAELLNTPAVLTREEQAALDQVTDEYVDLRRAPGIDPTVLLQLRGKGVVEFEKGRCRRRKVT